MKIAMKKIILLLCLGLLCLGISSCGRRGDLRPPAGYQDKDVT